MFDNIEEVAALCLLTNFYTLKQLHSAFGISTATLKRRFSKFATEIVNLAVPKPPKGPKSLSLNVQLDAELYNVALYFVRNAMPQDFFKYMTKLSNGEKAILPSSNVSSSSFLLPTPPMVDPTPKPIHIDPYTALPSFVPKSNSDFVSSQGDDLRVLSYFCV
ncbi:hypothetical protein GEMRC1_012326 [Eukaryota sp. GEM-RC1]